MEIENMTREELNNLVQEVIKRYAQLDKEDNSDDRYLSVGKLKKSLENVPDHYSVYYRRIEDVYFNENEWEIDSIIMDEPGCEEGYIRAFCGFKDKDINTGKNGFYITAHY
jgi:hypothetical protein